MELEKYKVLTGDFIELHKLTIDDAENIYNWRISESGKFMNQPDDYSLEFQKKWIVNRPESEINYIITVKGTGKKVGMIAIVGISDQDRNAEVGRLLLAPEFLKKSNPYGLEALKICFNQIINVWGFHKAYGNVLSENKDMLRMQKYLGMVEEGLLKDQKAIHGKLYDLYLVAIFSDRLNKFYLPRINMLLKSFGKVS